MASSGQTKAQASTKTREQPRTTPMGTWRRVHVSRIKKGDVVSVVPGGSGRAVIDAEAREVLATRRITGDHERDARVELVVPIPGSQNTLAQQYAPERLCWRLAGRLSVVPDAPQATAAELGAAPDPAPLPEAIPDGTVTRPAEGSHAGAPILAAIARQAQHAPMRSAGAEAQRAAREQQASAPAARARRQRIDAAFEERFRALHAEGLSMSAMQEALGYSGTLYALHKRFGLKPNRAAKP